MTFQTSLKMLLAGSILALTGCCMDDACCGGGCSSYVPVSSCNTCMTGCSTCQPRVSSCCNSCAVSGYDGSYAYTSWY